MLAYIAAHFNNIMVSDRGTEHCNQSNSSEGWAASWHYIKRQIAIATDHNLSSLVDSYRCLPWGPPTNIGGDAQGTCPSGWCSPTGNHKITLPEVKVRPKVAVPCQTLTGRYRAVAGAGAGGLAGGGGDPDHGRRRRPGAQ